MAKLESAKMAVSLDNDSKRIIRNLTKAIDRLSRNMRPYEVKDGARRLSEPHEPGREEPLVPGESLHDQYLAGVGLSEVEPALREMLDT